MRQVGAQFFFLSKRTQKTINVCVLAMGARARARSIMIIIIIIYTRVVSA